MRAVNNVLNMSSASLTGGNSNKSAGSSISKTIASVSKPGTEEKKVDSTDEAEDSEQTEAGKKATGKEDANQATTVTTDSANKKAVDKTVSKGIDIGKVLQDTKETEQAWVKTGAETDKPLPTLLESIPGYPAIPQSDRGQILANFNELQKTFNIQEPSNLIGNPADPKQFASAQMSGLSGQALLGPGSGAFNHLDGAARTPLVVNNQAIAVSNSGPSVSSSRPVVEQTFVASTPEPEPEPNPLGSLVSKNG
jgi:hypothetical protein